MAAVRIAGARPIALAAATQQPSTPPPPPVPARPAFDIRPSQLREDLQRAAWLRAEAYYENRSVGRFKQSFIKQFAGQELYALLRRTQGAAPQCIALVATLEGSGAAGGAAGGEAGPGPCIGTLDVRLLDPTDPFASAGWPDGVPLLEPSATPASGASSSSAAAAAAGGKAAAAAAYVSNVVVAPAQRGRGLGRALVSAGLEAARQQWGVGQLYCHVELDNEAALALYRGAGFCQLGEPLPPTEDGLDEATDMAIRCSKYYLENKDLVAECGTDWTLATGSCPDACKKFWEGVGNECMLDQEGRDQFNEWYEATCKNRGFPTTGASGGAPPAENTDNNGGSTSGASSAAAGAAVALLATAAAALLA